MHKNSVLKMQSLPEDAKRLFINSFEDENKQISTITYLDQIALVKDLNYIDLYSATAQDIFADDWMVVG